jgi:hypothetical protein
MASPDDLAVRMYNSTVARHKKNAKNALDDLRRALSSMDLNSPTLALSTARNAAATLAELNAALSALNTTEDLRFLAEKD